MSLKSINTAPQDFDVEQLGWGRQNNSGDKLENNSAVNLVSGLTAF